MKKIISIICCIGLILSSVMLVFPALAVENTSIEQFAEDMSELYEEESVGAKSVEDSAKCRVIVKATSKPDTYKSAECVVGNNDLYIYQYSDAEIAQKAVEYYNSLPYVKWAELDGIVESQALPYGNYMMQGDEAKEYITESNLNKEEIIVAVLDTGAYFDSPVYNGRVIDSGYNFSDTGINNSAESDHPHGDYVATIIVDNTSENVKIYAYKVLDELGYGANSAVSLGIDMAVADGADIINMSLGSDEFSNAIYDSIKAAYSKGVIVVCAAGNEGDDVSKYYPASFDEVVTVGSIDRNGNYCFFSNFGEEVDFVAPGHFIDFDSDIVEIGTSFSAPFISAAAATVRSVNPELTINDTKNVLIESSITYEDLSYHDGFHAVYDYEDSNHATDFYVGEPENERLYYGFGMPQIANAVAIATGNYLDAKEPILSSKTGIYNESFSVSISVPEDYEVYYTFDESYPSKSNGMLYTEPVYIEESQSIRAVAYSPDGIKSNPISGEYKMQYFADESDFSITSEGYIDDYAGSLKEFIVPDSINGIEVTGVNSRAFYRRNDMTGIVLPESATFIGKSAFDGASLKYLTAQGLETVEDRSLCCKELIELDAPNITSVGVSGIGGTKLRTLDLPKLTEADNSAFAENKNLKYISLPSLEYVNLRICKENHALKTVKLDSATTIDAEAFSNCYRLKNIYAPVVTEFVCENPRTQKAAFYCCYNLTEVFFPQLVSSPEQGLFVNCNNLETVNLPTIKYIGKYAFNYCLSLSSLYAPEAIEVSNSAFSYTQNLYELTLENVITFGDNIFRNSGIKSLYAPKLKDIGEYTFSNYSDMYSEYVINNTFENLYAPKLETASDYAFAYTGALTKLELPSLTDLGENAFLESSVSYLDAPNLKNTSSLPTAENSIAILSSEFSECSLDAKGYSLTIYGTPDTYAQTYAEQYGLTFIAAPAIINDLPTEYFEGNLTFDVAGFNKAYQWYGTNNATKTGTPISGAINADFDPTGQNFKYYYCVVSSNDNGHTETVKTSLCQNMLYSVLIVPSNARITIATPSNRYLKYGESINLYANATGLPEGAKIKWRIVEGNGVTLDPSVSGAICTVTSKSNGFVTIEAYAVNKNGNTLVNDKGNRICDQEGISSEVSLWWIILYYIRQMFGITKTAVNFAIWS